MSTHDEEITDALARLHEASEELSAAIRAAVHVDPETCARAIDALNEIERIAEALVRPR